MARARLVPVDGVPATVVTMNARVRLRDLATGEDDEYTLVYPGEDESLLAGRLSVMTPLGTAILGTREGDVIPWRVPAGVRRLLVAAVPHQPEAAAGRAATTAGPASGRGWWRRTLDLYGGT